MSFKSLVLISLEVRQNPKVASSKRYILLFLLPANKKVDVVIFMAMTLGAYEHIFIQRSIQIIHLNVFKMYVFPFYRNLLLASKTKTEKTHVDSPQCKPNSLVNHVTVVNSSGSQTQI